MAVLARFPNLIFTNIPKTGNSNYEQNFIKLRLILRLETEKNPIGNLFAFFVPLLTQLFSFCTAGFFCKLPGRYCSKQ